MVVAVKDIFCPHVWARYLFTTTTTTSNGVIRCSLSGIQAQLGNFSSPGHESSHCFGWLHGAFR